MSKAKMIFRIGAISALLAVFAYGAFYLYKKQQAQINYLSFQISDQATSLLINDLDKFKTKIDSQELIESFKIDSTFKESFDRFFNSDIDFQDEDLNSCMFSFDEDNFLFVLKTEASVETITLLLQEKFDVSAILSESKLQIGSVELFTSYHEGFVLLSTNEFVPEAMQNMVDFTSADIIEFNSLIPTGKKHILSDGMHYQVWSENTTSLKGKTVNSEPFFEIAPATFTAFTFYGSSRMSEDQEGLFTEPNEGSFDWLGDGLLHCQKDSFAIVIARPNSERDLGLILEEQTLKSQEDSVLTPYFNIGKFKVLPFKTRFNWESSIPSLKQKLGYYTEYNNFNILASSIPAMRWYLSQVQLGNLLPDNEKEIGLYRSCVPTKAHYVHIEKNAANYICESSIFQKNDLRLRSKLILNNQSSNESGVTVLHEFTVSFVPEVIQVEDKKEGDLVLLSSANNVELFDVKGDSKWKRSLTDPLVMKPQIVDFENDGDNEYVFFQLNKVDVVKMNGQSLKGFPVAINGVSKAGLAVNYDNQFVYRIIVNTGNTIKIISEEGKFVDGWVFNGMAAPIKSQIYHVLTAGKDIIAFKDQANNQYIVNRKGESRLTNPVAFSLKNETDFVVGGMESSLRKMGYENGYILNYYVLDGERDSIKIDQNVAPIAVHWEYNSGNPLLIIEESTRLLIVDQFGYVKSEVLKPSQTNNFVGLVGSKEYGFVFSDITQNSIYLLNNYGKMLLPNSVQGSSVCTIHSDLLYTISGVTLKAYKINN